MAKGKYEYWLTEDGLVLLRAWARDGLDYAKIAQKCGVCRDTLNEWRKSYPVISDALTRGREIVDVEVENSLLKKCHGYTVDLEKSFKCKRVEYDPDTGKRIREYEELVTGIDQMHVPADTVAQKFWLINRKRDTWQNEPSPPPDTAAVEKAEELLGGVNSAI